MPTILLTFATVSWQKGSAAQVVSLVNELSKVRQDIRFTLLSHCPDLDGQPAQDLGIEIVGPMFSLQATRNQRSLLVLWKRLQCTILAIRRRTVQLPRRWKYDPVAQAYAEADFVLDLSGDSYRDPPGGFAPAHHVNFLAALATGTPYGLASQSLGPFYRIDAPLVRYFLKRADFIYIREKKTQEILLQLGVRPRRIQLAPDVAFALPKASPSSIWTGEKLEPDRIHRPWIACSVSCLSEKLAASKRGNHYLEEMAHLCNHLHRRYDASVFLVPHVINPPYFGPDDRSTAHALYVGMGHPSWLYGIKGDYGPCSLKGFISQCDVLIAARMHAAIAGLSSGVPTIPVAWSHKYVGLMEEIGLAKYVWHQDSQSLVSLCDLFDQLWEEREPIRTRLLDYTAGAQMQIAEIIEEIAMHI
jgi:colanic acid/amylovoran biosynthesis protein WcaK/AmsJ